jgi:hydroxymethylglutaryl-CoA synthase
VLGIESYSAYLPAPRLDLSDAARVIGGRGRGARPVASYDEDTTTMAVEAARLALTGTPAVGTLWFATSRPAYAEKSNATTVAVASGLDAGVAAYDVAGTLRGAAGALRAGLATGRAAVVFSDIRYGLPGSVDEQGGADAAAAFVIGPDPVAELVGSASVSSEFLDRWREPGQARTRTWEERFGVEEYVPLVERVVQDVLASADLTREQVDHVVVSIPHVRAGAAIGRGWRPEQLAAADVAGLGFAGAADLALRLGAVLDASRPGQSILAVSAADGADAFLFRATARHAPRERGGIADRMRTGYTIGYGDFLNWRGLLPREPARRPDFRPPVPPASRRNVAWKFGFIAAQCADCGYRNMPPRRVCLRCSATEGFVPVSMVEVPGRVATFTDDWLSESIQLPAKVVAVDFDGGGRFECEMTDAVGRGFEIGDRVRPTFRLAGVGANGVRNYVWKVRPVDEEDA